MVRALHGPGSPVGRWPATFRATSMSLLRCPQPDRVLVPRLSYQLKPGAAFYLGRPYRDREGEQGRGALELA